jgi:hypothetical protein
MINGDTDFEIDLMKMHLFHRENNSDFAMGQKELSGNSGYSGVQINKLNHFLGSTWAGLKIFLDRTSNDEYTKDEGTKPEIRLISNVIRSCHRLPSLEPAIF